MAMETQMEDKPAVVVIEDEESMREGCRQTLEENGYTTHVAVNGEEGLLLVKETSPQVALIDLKMPGMGGMEVLTRIRQNDPDVVPIVITGYGTTESAVDAMKIGAFDYLTKPFNETALLDRVARGIDIFHQRASVSRIMKHDASGRRRVRKHDENRTDVLVIGGSAAGIVTAVTGKNHYPNKDFMVIRKEKSVLVPCGIPYIFGTLGSSDKNVIPDTVLTKAGIRLKIGEVVDIDAENKNCTTGDGARISFDKLVLAIGSTPVIPQWLKGRGLDNVFTIQKDKSYLDQAGAALQKCRSVVTIGGGFIGVEVSDELNKAGKDVTVVEILPHILCTAFDEELAIRAESTLTSRGVKVKCGVGVKEILGDGNVSGVLLDNGERIDAQAVILSMGYRPNTGLAAKSAIELNENGLIKVDEYMRTENRDIFAVGDCAEKRGFSTRRPTGAMLASTACAEARVAGQNLYELCTVKAFNGTIAIFSTAIGETGFGAAGLTEQEAKRTGFDVVTGTFEGVDKHPGTLPDTHKTLVKLIVASDSGILLGGEVAGGASIGELTNLIGLAIQNRMTVNSVLTTQVGTHPLLTASPTAYPLIKAAEIAAKEMARAKETPDIAKLIRELEMQGPLRSAELVH